jgi:hypothetical protein
MPLSAPIWFVTAFVPMMASQVLRLHQDGPGGSLLGIAADVWADSRFCATMAFRREKLQMSWMQLPLWVLGIVLLNH